jgi:hypothetical protein
MLDLRRDAELSRIDHRVEFQEGQLLWCPPDTRVPAGIPFDRHACDSGACATGIFISLTPADRRRLEAIIKDGKSAQKHAWRAAIVLLSADGVCTNAIMRQTGKAKTLRLALAGAVYAGGCRRYPGSQAAFRSRG